MQLAADTTLTQTESCGAGQLARFFPDVAPAHIRAVLTLQRAGSAQVREAVLIEFAGAEKVILTSALPLEFGDRIRLVSESGKPAEARVIAVQYQDGRTAVAAQVLNGQLSWKKS